MKALCRLATIVCLILAAVALGSEARAQANQAPDPAATQRLFEAVFGNDLAAVQSAVTAGADINARNDWGVTATDLAVDRGYFEIAHYLLSVRNFRRQQEDDDREREGRFRANRNATTGPATPSGETPPAAPSPGVRTAPLPPAPAAKAPASEPTPWPADKPNPFDVTTPLPDAPPVLGTEQNDRGAATPAQPSVTRRQAPSPARTARPTPAPAVPKPAPAPRLTAPPRTSPQAVTVPATPSVTEAPAPIGKSVTTSPTPPATASVKPQAAEPAPAPERATTPSEPKRATASTPGPAAPQPSTREATAPATSQAEEPGLLSGILGQVSSLFGGGTDSDAAKERPAGPAPSAPKAKAAEAVTPTAPPAPATRPPPQPARKPRTIAAASPAPVPPAPSAAPETTAPTTTRPVNVGPRRGSFVLGLDRRLGHRFGDIADTRRHQCAGRAGASTLFCLVPVQWPPDLSEAFTVSSIAYHGQQAVVRYDQERATSFYVLFGSGANQAVREWVKEHFGAADESRIDPIRLPGKPHVFDAVDIWRRDPGNGPVQVLAVHGVDSVRKAFPDTRHGVILLYEEGSQPIFPQLSTIDLMMMR